MWIDGVGFITEVSDFNTPEIMGKIDPQEAIGMYGVVEFPSGIEAMTATGTLNSVYPALLGVVANPTKVYTVQVRSNIEQHTAAGVTNVGMVVTMVGTFSKFPGFEFAAQTPVTGEFELKVRSYRLTVAGVEVAFFDAMNSIHRAGGADTLAERRANLGIS